MPRPAPPARLLMTRRLPGAVMDRAAAAFDIHGNPDDAVWPVEELLSRIKELHPELILCAPTDRMSAAFFAGLPKGVKMIATYSVGHDHIDLAAAGAAGIVVSNTPDVLTSATADIAMLCLLGAARRANQAQEDLRAGRWGNWAPTGYLGLELDGATLGIVGMGRIGQATARRARAFGMRIRYWNRMPVSPSALAAEGLGGAEHVPDLDDLFARCDVVSLHVPETPQTRHMVNARRIALMRRGAVLVNTARGGLVDDAAVLNALATGQLMGVGLDVFDGEPAFHQGYLNAANAFLLPHIGSATVRTRDAMGFRALDNLLAFAAGKPPPDRIA